MLGTLLQGTVLNRETRSLPSQSLLSGWKRGEVNSERVRRRFSEVKRGIPGWSSGQDSTLSVQGLLV